MQGFTPTAFLLVAAGGALGSMLRHGASLLGLALFGTGFPWGTLAVNIVGSAAIGAVAAAGLEGQARLLVVPGLLGGFTTFSAFSLEATILWERSPAIATAYVAASIGLGFAACLAGYWLLRR
jgi:CrcB protein